MGTWTSSYSEAGENERWRERLVQLGSKLTLPSDFKDIEGKLYSGQSLNSEDGNFLFRHPDLTSVAQLANLVKEARYEKDVFFNHNVHLNHTNVCVLACKFCAFRRSKHATDAYSMSTSDYLQELSAYAPFVDEVHSVGGLHPELKVEFFEKLFADVKLNYPHISIKALTAVEVKHIAEISEISVRELLQRLKIAGLNSLPGGGAEILDDDIRDIICRGKEASSEYIDIHRTAHNIGLPTNCTMLFGTIESISHRISHLIMLRELQDETGGFQCFVPYPYLPDQSRLPEAQLASGNEILRVIAVSRLMLDNIPHVKAYRMNLGDELSELALKFGADDMDGTVHMESIMHLAGSSTPLNHDLGKMARIIEDAGCNPVQRNTTYTHFKKFISPKTPVVKKLPIADA